MSLSNPDQSLKLSTFSLNQSASYRLDQREIRVVWHLTLPRRTITHLLQVKDGGEGRDSFPSWGLKIKSASDNRNWFGHVVSVIYLGSNTRYRSILFRLPYEHSYWLGIVIARWASARLELCRR